MASLSVLRNPEIDPLASSTNYGAKHLPPSSTVAASSLILCVCHMKPRLFIRNFTPPRGTPMLPS